MKIILPVPNSKGERLVYHDTLRGLYVECPKCGTWVKIGPDDFTYVVCPSCKHIIELPVGWSLR